VGAVKARKRGSAWKVESNSVPHELLAALPTFTDPVERDNPNELQMFKPLVETFAAPAQLRCDWRTSGAMSQPSFQGGCNTCTSFAVASMVEALHFLKAKTRIRLAPGFIHSCLLGRACNDGATAKEALDASVARGIALGFTGDYPYPTSSCATTNRYRVGPRVRLSSTNEAMLALLNHGPIVADMFIDPSFVNLAPGAVYRLEDPDNSVLHSICVVGYDQQAQYWIVMNSYGAGWGDGGFGHIAFGAGGLLSTRAGWQVELASHQ
jgi:hypothetical protein